MPEYQIIRTDRRVEHIHADDDTHDGDTATLRVGAETITLEPGTWLSYVRLNGDERAVYYARGKR